MALFVAFVVLAFTISGLRDKVSYYLADRKLNLLYQLVDCNFCLSFWITFCISIILAIFSQDSRYLLIPVFSTPLSKLLL